MSLVDDIRSEATAMRDAVTSAQTTADGAHAHAGRIADEANRMGFRGIAGRLIEVQRAVVEIRSRLVAADDRLDEARTSIGTASAQSSPQQVIDAVAPVQAAVGTVQDIVSETIAQVSSAQRLVAAALDGGQPGPMLARLESIRTTLAGVLGQCDMASRHVTAALAQAQQAGVLGTGGAVGGVRICRWSKVCNRFTWVAGRLS
jgi:hypothetical protein